MLDKSKFTWKQKITYRKFVEKMSSFGISPEDCDKIFTGELDGDYALGMSACKRRIAAGYHRDKPEILRALVESPLFSEAWVNGFCDYCKSYQIVTGEDVLGAIGLS